MLSLRVQHRQRHARVRGHGKAPRATDASIEAFVTLARDPERQQRDQRGGDANHDCGEHDTTHRGDLG